MKVVWLGLLVGLLAVAVESLSNALIAFQNLFLMLVTLYSLNTRIGAQSYFNLTCHALLTHLGVLPLSEQSWRRRGFVRGGREEVVGREQEERKEKLLLGCKINKKKLASSKYINLILKFKI